MRVEGEVERERHWEGIAMREEYIERERHLERKIEKGRYLRFERGRC